MAPFRKRNRSVSSWLNQAEHRAFRARCAEEGARPSVVVRTLIGEYAAGRDVSPKIHDVLVSVRDEVRRVGINLNQAVHLAHSDALKGAASDLQEFLMLARVLVGAVDQVVLELTPYWLGRQRG